MFTFARKIITNTRNGGWEEKRESKNEWWTRRDMKCEFVLCTPQKHTELVGTYVWSSYTMWSEKIVRNVCIDIHNTYDCFVSCQSLFISVDESIYGYFNSVSKKSQWTNPEVKCVYNINKESNPLRLFWRQFTCFCLMKLSVLICLKSRKKTLDKR